MYIFIIYVYNTDYFNGIYYFLTYVKACYYFYSLCHNTCLFGPNKITPQPSCRQQFAGSGLVLSHHRHPLSAYVRCN